MKVTQKKLEGGKLRLEAVATAEEVNRALKDAHLQFAQQMGLRPVPNKTVAQVAEEQMGIKNLDSVIEAQAVDALVPYAIDKKNLIPAYQPKPQPKTPLHRDQPFTFVLEVDPKPDYELTSYDPVDITVPAFRVSDEQVNQQIAATAERFAEYVKADPHPVEKGDSCLLELKAFENGEPLPGMTTDGRTYTTGQGYMPDGFDEAIIGMEVGETKTFTFEGPSLDADGNECTQTVECTATVKEIQKKVIPAITDAWVAKYMPIYKTADEFKQSIRDNIEKQGAKEYEDYKLQAAAAELAKRFQGKIADEVYENMRSNLMQNIRGELQQQGKSFDDFVNEQGGEQQFGIMMMMQTRELLVQGYALDAVFRHEHLTLSDDDVNAACSSINPRMNPKQLRQQLEQSGRGFVLRETAERLKANKWVLDHANITVKE